VSNSVQLAVRAALIALLLPSVGVVAIPIAFAATAGAEALGLGTILALKLRRRSAP
jgi:hypothetical protein